MDIAVGMVDKQTLESIVNNPVFNEPVDVETFFIAYTKYIWDHKMIGRIYDHYTDGTVIHGENGVDICGIDPVIAHTSERLQTMPDIKINFHGIWATKVSEEEFRFIQITYPEGTFTGPSRFGPPTGKKLDQDNIMNMCECLVKRVDGIWKIVEEWGLLGYANFFSEGRVL